MAGDARVLAPLGHAEGGGEGACDLNPCVVGGQADAVEGEDELDEVGSQHASDVEVLELAADMEPGVERGEEEAGLGEEEAFSLCELALNRTKLH